VSQTIGHCESALHPVQVSISVAPVAKLRPDTALCKGGELQIGGPAIDGVNYKWNTGATTCCISVTETNLYILQVSNGCGTVSDSVDLYFANCQQCLWAPDAFTPNGDGKNDVYRLQVQCPMSDYHLLIYNRWGQIMFDTYDAKKGWDGTWKGDEMPVDTYFYKVEALSALPGATKIFLKGDLTLIR
jgi:gliding motility-associated-like protein